MKKINLPPKHRYTTKRISQNPRRTSSKYFGVDYLKRDNKWRARVCILGTKGVHWGGMHETEEQAAMAVDALIRQHRLNIPINFPSANDSLSTKLNELKTQLAAAKERIIELETTIKVLENK